MAVVKFTYRSGQRPLDGFTLKRGVGQGGEGEVYFAVSDGGKEVALKLLHGHTDAELRGISHCLNLKHPNLVHLYDLRTDVRGEKWVVMEYVSGESLAQVVGRHPKGLPPELIREWVGALARGVSYLHDQGVVHRDLKPANIFVEHGVMKVGDYGLSRRMSASERGDVTRGVGTPHYMAPEVKNGNYGRSINIYACGVILFEMLTGHPPFTGETAAEVLMRHQLDVPDLSKIPPPIQPVLQRVLEKDPAKRFATVMDFARAAEGAIGNRAEVDGPVSSAASVAAAKPPTTETVVEDRPAAPSPRKAPPAPPRRSDVPGTFRERFMELAGSFTTTPIMAGFLTALCALIPLTPWPVLANIFILTTVLTWSLLVLGRLPQRDQRSTWSRRIVQLLVGCGIGVLAFWLDGWAVPTGTASASSRDLILPTGHRFSPETVSIALRYVFFFGLTTAAFRWWAASERRRKSRVRLIPVLAMLFWACVFAFLWPWETSPVSADSDGLLAAFANSGIAPLVLATVALQAASPWSGPPVPVAHPVRMRSRYAFAR